jgi:hypothetical protein
MTGDGAANDKKTGKDDGAPVAMLLCADLMFAVQLQSIARASGFKPVTLRPGGSVPPEAAVLVVNLADLAGPRTWESAIREAAALGVHVVAFGPHVDADSRRAAKEAGASRVLANSNLARDLPTILHGLHPDRDKGL